MPKTHAQLGLIALGVFSLPSLAFAGILTLLTGGSFLTSAAIAFVLIPLIEIVVFANMSPAPKLDEHGNAAFEQITTMIIGLWFGLWLWMAGRAAGSAHLLLLQVLCGFAAMLAIMAGARSAKPTKS